MRSALRTKLRIILASSLLVLAGFCAVALGQDEAPLPTTPREVQDLVNSTPEDSNPVEQPPGTVAFKRPFPDSGPAEDVAQVKTDALAGLVQDGKILMPLAPPPNLREQLAQIYAAAEVDAVYNDTREAMLGTATDPDFVAYEDFSVPVAVWQGVAVEGTEGFALLQGRVSYRETLAGWNDGPDQQWHLELRKEDGKWKFKSVKAVALDEVPHAAGKDVLP